MNSPDTPRRPVREQRRGTEIVDPYRWLEDGDDPAVAEWTDDQNAHTDAVLDGPRRQILADRFDDVAGKTDYGTLEPAGGRYFGEVRDPDADQPVVCVRDDPDGERRVLLDPNDWSDEGTVSVDWFVPSPDGELLAYGVAPSGTEQYDLHVLNVESGEVVEELADVGRSSGRGFAWAPGGFYYTWTGSPESTEVTDDADAEGGSTDQLYKDVRYHELGSDPEDDVTITDDVGETVWPVLTSEDDTLVVEFSKGWDRSDVFALRGDERALTPVVTGYDAVFEPTLHEGTLYLLTNYDADRSRLLGANADRALAGDVDPDALTEVVPEGEAVLRDVVAAEDRLLVHAHEDVQSRLDCYEIDDPDSGPSPAELTTEISLDAFATVAELRAGDEPTAFYTVESFDRPASVEEANLETGESRTVLEPDAGFDVDLTVSQEWTTSADGTDVPAFVVRREGVEPDGTNPGLLTGYGGFRVNRTPTFDPYLEPFLEAGGVFVLATLRGGTEFGERWHDAGRRARKSNVFDDFLAVAEELTDRGWVADDRLGIAGGSNGGLLVGAALTRRPALFDAVLCRVPLLDMLRFHRFLLGGSWTSEYGNPDDAEAFDYLHDYSPYHNVDARAYPATLFETAASDTRVHPCHARKTAARVQHRTTGDDPILLRIRSDAGHGVGKPRSMVTEEKAENWTFLCRHLNVDANELAR